MDHDRIIKNINDDLEKLYNEDITLYFEVYRRLPYEYEKIKAQEKIKICEERGYHDFLDWKEKVEDVRHDDVDDFGEPWVYTTKESVFYRKCKYCGDCEKAYGIDERYRLTDENNAKKLSLKNNK